MYNAFSINPRKKPVFGTGQPNLSLSNNNVRMFGDSQFPSANQFSSQPKSVPKAPQNQVQSQQFQASGPTSQFASNPSSYKTIQPGKMYDTPAGPDNKPFVAPKLPNNTTATMNYMDYATNAAQKKQALQIQQAKEQQDFITEQNRLSNDQLRSSSDGAETNFNQMKSDTESTISDLIAGGERQKNQTRDYQGEAQRNALQANRELRGQTQRTFANLGTIDSRGEGSFAEATQNQESDLNTFLQRSYKATADKLSEIDTTVSSAERSARATIVSEQAKIQDMKRSIQFSIANNDLQKARDLKEVLQSSQNYIAQVEDSIASMKYQFGLESEKLQNEMRKSQSFSPEFMNTGKYTNQAEYEFFIKNKDAVNSLNGGGQASAGKQEVVDAIKDLMSSPGGLKQVVGYGNYNPLNRLPEANAGATRAKLERVKALVSLENASKLKGTGAISDAERALLASAATAINGNMSPEQVESELNRIMQQFGGTVQGASGGGQTITAPDGQQIILTD